MRANSRMRRLGVLSGLFAIMNCALAQTWTQTSAPNFNYHAVALSADGAKILAVARDGPIVFSTNSGMNWNITSAPITNWYAMASSADGTKLLATASLERPIYTSRDSGVTWTAATNELYSWYYSCAASSADGNTLYFGAYDGVHHSGWMWRSTDGGSTWSGIGPAAVSVASSADGTKLLVADGPSGLNNFSAWFVTSTNSGATWASTAVPSSLGWDACASSADGTKLVAANADSTGLIYTSKNSGATWITNAVPVGAWISLACSADGSKLVGAKGGCFNPGGPACGGPVYTSTDSGGTWVSNNVPEAFAVGSSADGNKLVAISGTEIWISETLPAPSLNVARAATNILLSWIVPSVKFVLQHNSDLTTTNWTDVTNTPALNFTNVAYEVSVSTSESNRFYRLRR